MDEGIIAKAVKGYDGIFEYADARVSDWFMMGSPVPTLIICLAYFVFVWLSPRIIRDRKPLELRNILVVYNLAMVVLSTYIFYEFLVSGWLNGYSLGCQPVDFSSSPLAIRMAKACWLFYISKFIELLDTVFFILRKKFNQVSFLHVFHHGVMPISWWFGVRFVPGGFSTFHAMLNSFIHLVMYTYYGLSAMGPAFQKYLWWKKYMTSMQITQFVLVMLHSSQLLFMECNYPTVFVYWIGAYAIIFLIMFANFYIQAYRQAAPSPARRGTNGSAQVKPKVS